MPCGFYLFSNQSRAGKRKRFATDSCRVDYKSKKTQAGANPRISVLTPISTNQVPPKQTTGANLANLVNLSTNPSKKPGNTVATATAAINPSKRPGATVATAIKAANPSKKPGPTVATAITAANQSKKPGYTVATATTAANPSKKPGHTVATEICTANQSKKSGSTVATRPSTAPEVGAEHRGSDGKKVTGGILLFKGERNPLSNLYRLKKPFIFKGRYFYSTENAYQWQKAKHHGNDYLANRILAETSRNAMYLGKSIKTNDSWKTQKAGLMTELVCLKKDTSKEYRDYLLSTTTAILVENTSHPYWGKGFNDKGLNILGVIHTEIRESLFRKLKTCKVD